MNRREFITLLGGAAAWPLSARAQQPVLPVIGFLSSGLQQSDAFRLAAFQHGLNETGYVEGRQVASEHRWAEDHYDRLPGLAAELVRRQIAVIVAVGGPTSALAAKAATTTIPIVFTIGSDPVKLGLVASLNRPGGNVTGVTTLANMIVAKQFELLHETVPKAMVVGLLVNPNNPLAETDTREAQDATRTLGLQLHISNASAEGEIDIALTTLAQKGAGAVVVVSDALFNSRPDQLAALAVRHALPAIHLLREFATAGGLMSYGNSLADAYRQAGVYTGRILKGDKPADLPVVQATKVELVINLRTAKTLGLTFPNHSAGSRQRGDRVKRREVITLLGAAAMWPLAARAQPGERMRRIGVLMNLAADDPEGQTRLVAFVQGLQQLGWTVGRNMRIDTRWAAGDAERIRKYAAELVALSPDVIFTAGGPTVGPLQQTTRSVPIVFAIVIDPVGAGYVESLARPGGNTTGFMNLEYGISGKWLELIKQIAPRVTRVAVLRDPAIASGIGQLGAIQGVAPGFGVEVTPVGVRDRAGHHGVCARLEWRPDRDGERVGFHRSRSDRHACRPTPAACGLLRNSFVRDGGLISYGPDLIRSVSAGGRLRRSHSQG